MLDKTNLPIFITGIERSGSTIVAKIINMCGALCGKVNSRYENLPLKEHVDFYYRNVLKINENGQFPFPDDEDLLIPKKWKYNVLIKAPIENEKYWMYKSSRIAQLWPIWNYAFPNAKYILVRRKSSDVIKSCINTGYMKAFKNEETLKLLDFKTEREGWLWWIHQYENRMVNMIENGLNCKVIWPDRMVDGDYKQMIETIEWLGLKWDNSVIDLVERLFIKERSKYGTYNC